jgi:gamma-glutamyltranspeptidase / glutathione hydrolase
VHVPAQALLDPTYIQQRAALISPQRALEKPMPGVLPAEKQVSLYLAAEASQTSNVSIVDAQGNAISMTTTINLGFGA